ncbi:hypothetical protein DUI70_3190 [Streptomyces albus]|nr:hypothetical protein SLNHY_3245 [Streptomyces albus]AYN33690.1 hypothetical protein DUI70_3190 [Streptomyces albus]
MLAFGDGECHLSPPGVLSALVAGRAEQAVSLEGQQRPSAAPLRPAQTCGLPRAEPASHGEEPVPQTARTHGPVHLLQGGLVVRAHRTYPRRSAVRQQRPVRSGCLSRADHGSHPAR